MTVAAWIQTSERLPEVNQAVWYFFEVTGVDEGHYYGVDEEEECGLPTFGGQRGYLGGDVTHWMPRESSETAPAAPEGYTYPERCLVHGARMPFDSVETWRLGTREAPAPPARNWAHAAARGVFQSLYDNHEFRTAMRAIAEDKRAKFVDRTAAIIEVALAQRGEPRSDVSPLIGLLPNGPMTGDGSTRYDFDLTFSLQDPESDPASHIGLLQANGCDNAIIGVGRKGRLKLGFTRMAPTGALALVTSIEDVQRAVPGAQLIEIRTFDPAGGCWRTVAVPANETA